MFTFNESIKPKAKNYTYTNYYVEFNRDKETKIRVTARDNKVIAQLYKRGMKKPYINAVAKCHPSDTFNLEEGIRIAMSRLREQEKAYNEARAKVNKHYMIDKRTNERYETGAVVFKGYKVGAKVEILVHNREYVIITEIKENGDIEAINPNRGEKVTILPKKNVFGFNYVTKIVNIADNMFPKIETATEENPFGNIQQMLMFSALMDNNSNSGDSMMKLMLLNNMGGMKLESGTMPFLAAMLSNM